jgi:hypothetical protein
MRLHVFSNTVDDRNSNTNSKSLSTWGLVTFQNCCSKQRTLERNSRKPYEIVCQITARPVEAAFLFRHGATTAWKREEKGDSKIPPNMPLRSPVDL